MPGPTDFYCFFYCAVCAVPVHGGHRGSGSWVTLLGRGSGTWATVAPVPG